MADCPICACVYDVDAHKPRILPCAHTFCTDCLQKLVVFRQHAMGNQAVTCPNCRSCFAVPRAGVVALPCNFALQDLLASNSTPAATPTSRSAPSSFPPSTAARSVVGSQCQHSSCAGGGPATHQCLDCGAALCMPHSLAHASEKGTLGHRVAACAGGPTSMMCSEHSDELVSMYCRTHNRPLCRSCCSLVHRSCTHESIQDAFQRLRPGYSMLIKQSHAVVAAVQAMAQSVAEDRQVLTEQRGVLEKQIAEYFDGLERTLQARRAQLLQHSEQVISLKTSRLDEQRAQLNKLSSEVTLAREQLETLLASPDAIQVLTTPIAAQLQRACQNRDAFAEEDTGVLFEPGEQLPFGTDLAARLRGCGRITVTAPDRGEQQGGATTRQARDGASERGSGGSRGSMARTSSASAVANTSRPSVSRHSSTSNSIPAPAPAPAPAATLGSAAACDAPAAAHPTPSFPVSPATLPSPFFPSSPSSLHATPTRGPSSNSGQAHPTLFFPPTHAYSPTTTACAPAPPSVPTAPLQSSLSSPAAAPSPGRNLSRQLSSSSTSVERGSLNRSAIQLGGPAGSTARPLNSDLPSPFAHGPPGATAAAAAAAVSNQGSRAAASSHSGRQSCSSASASALPAGPSRHPSASSLPSPHTTPPLVTITTQPSTRPLSSQPTPQPSPHATRRASASASAASPPSQPRGANGGTSKVIFAADQPCCRVLCDFDAREPDELSVCKGDVVALRRRVGQWFEGELNGSVGIFPSIYVQVLKDL
eukprot:m.196289 g.196289  ORF g.196289 m.196289 type:complete len:761 (+) comp15462_c3_seq12:1228-3510(+)